MGLLKPSVLVFACALGFTRSHVSYIGVPNHLHPVHSLYVKPSTDGTTGDLYVAATEDNGVKSSWLTDQPVNFLPQQMALPVSYSSALTTTHLPHDETIVTNQKRAVITSPAVKYTYALPVDGSSYPYAVPSTSTTTKTATEGSGCSDASSLYPYPYHLYYSNMMAAFANALNSIKESSADEDTTSTPAVITPTAAAPAWPYSYPVQYVMVDPSAWGKIPSTTPQPTSTPATPEAASDEIE